MTDSQQHAPRDNAREKRNSSHSTFIRRARAKAL